MITEREKQTYAGIYVLKKLDLAVDAGGLEFPVVLPHVLAPLEPVLESLVLSGFVSIERKRGRYQLTPRGIEYVGSLIDEAEALIEEFDEMETSEMLAILRQRNLDPVRARFLWGWYQGEFDDLVLFQQRRNPGGVEDDWALYLLSDAFYDELHRDLED